ncbi:MAG: glycosyltransferase [Candidatus Parvarchaeota archaeon]|nr:glycosyltransferase [Candidatus Jingweiarchaeum tengchongense]
MIEYILTFLISLGLSWTIFYSIRKSRHYSLWMNFTFLMLVAITSFIISILTGEKWILYLLIPEVVIFFSGFARDFKRISNMTNMLIQLAVFVSVYFIMGIGISSLKDPFIGHDIFLGFLSPLVSLIWMFIITNSLATIGKIRGFLLSGTLLISSLVLLMTSSNVLCVSLFFAAFLGIFSTAFIRSLSRNGFHIGTSASQLFGFLIAILAIKGASLSATSVVLFVPIIFFLMLALQKIFAFLKHDNNMLSRTFLTPERIESKLISLGFTIKEFVFTSLILTLLISILDIIFRHNPQLVAFAVYVIMIILMLSVLRLFIFIRDYKDGDKRGKRIYVVNQYYHLENAATGEVLKDLCEALAQDGYDVVVLSARTSFSDPKSEIINGVRVERLCIIPKGQSLITKARGYANYFFWVWFRFAKVRRNSTILVLTTPPLIAFIPVLWKPFKEFKVVYNVQDLYPDVLNVLQMTSKNSTIYKVLKRIEHMIFSKSDYVVPIGNNMKKRIMLDYALSEEKILVIENRALKAHREYAKDIAKKRVFNFKQNGEFIVQYAGNLGRVHEFETILNTIKIVNEKNVRDIKFQFIGGGFNYDKLKSIVKKERIENVEFLPYVSPEEVINFLVNSDIQLVISRKHLLDTAFPSKFYGIVAVGKPMIYICDGEDDISEYINKYNFGFTIPNGNSEELFEKIMMLKKSPDILERLSINAMSLSQVMNYEQDVLKKYEILFDKLSAPNYVWKPVNEILL